MSIFGKTQVLNLTIVDGKPTAIKSVEEKNLFSGTLAAITSEFQEDQAVVGAGRLVATGLKVYGGMLFGNRQATGRFRWDPWAAN